ncbi:hypothetical protein [Streptomyces wedmorensis]|uniref:hypothetical protein n=1 Tax=Streptomyces wedmorensis TaxID=43759 RepID=UPI0037A61DB8
MPEVSPPSWDGIKLEFGDLTRYPVMAQALDNQWMPESMLIKARKQGSALDDLPDRQTVIRAEFRRALVNSGALVANRAFLINNEAVSSHFLRETDTSERSAFAALLREEALIPFLLYEDNPTEPPMFTYDHAAHRAWCELLSDYVTPACVRFSWDRDENNQATRALGNHFAKGITNLNRMEPTQLAKDLKIPRQQAEQMKQGVLQKIAEWAVGKPDEAITRNVVYQEFITQQGSGPHERVLRDDPNVIEVKQLVDLQYNVLVPVMSDVIAATPPQSPPRSALQELGRDAPRTDPEGLGKLLRGLLADTLMRHVDAPNSYGQMTLEQIIKLRREEEWNNYITSLEDLSKLDFRTNRIPDSDQLLNMARLAADQHAEMLRVARRIGSHKRTWTGEGRKLLMSLVLETPGLVALQLTQDHANLMGSTGQLSTTTGGTLLVRLVIEDIQRRRKGLDNLSHSITLSTLRLRHLRSDWEEILHAYGKALTESTAGVEADMADQQLNDE